MHSKHKLLVVSHLVLALAIACSGGGGGDYDGGNGVQRGWSWEDPLPHGNHLARGEPVASGQPCTQRDQETPS
jgi:hypothetical protein